MILKPSRAILVATFALHTVAAHAEDDIDFAHIMGGIGCALGPEAKMVDILPEPELFPELVKFSETQLAAGQAVLEGDWIVLGLEICTIRPPFVESAFTLADRQAQRAFDEMVHDEAMGEFGCFFSGTDFVDGLVLYDGFGPDTAAHAYYALMAKGVLDGQISFFSDDVLRTPPGPQSLVGPCAEVPDIAAIRSSNAALLEHFDTVIRRNAALVRCDGQRGPVDFEIAKTLSEVSAGQATNAWTMVEVLFVALAAGWIEGAGATENGTPRPPLCSFHP